MQITVEGLLDGSTLEASQRGGDQAVSNILNVAYKADKEECSVLEKFLKETDRYGKTLLHIACSRGDINMITAILKHISLIEYDAGSILCMTDNVGESVLHEACRQTNSHIIQVYL